MVIDPPKSRCFSRLEEDKLKCNVDGRATQAICRLTCSKSK